MSLRNGIKVKESNRRQQLHAPIQKSGGDNLTAKYDHSEKDINLHGSK
jgi:hypothetical protein